MWGCESCSLHLNLRSGISSEDGASWHIHLFQAVCWAETFFITWSIRAAGVGENGSDPQTAEGFIKSSFCSSVWGSDASWLSDLQWFGPGDSTRAGPPGQVLFVFTHNVPLHLFLWGLWKSRSSAWCCRLQPYAAFGVMQSHVDLVQPDFVLPDFLHWTLNLLQRGFPSAVEFCAVQILDPDETSWFLENSSDLSFNCKSSLWLSSEI